MPGNCYLQEPESWSQTPGVSLEGGPEGPLLPGEAFRAGPSWWGLRDLCPASPEASLRGNLCQQPPRQSGEQTAGQPGGGGAAHPQRPCTLVSSGQASCTVSEPQPRTQDDMARGSSIPSSPELKTHLCPGVRCQRRLTTSSRLPRGTQQMQTSGTRGSA